MTLLLDELGSLDCLEELDKELLSDLAIDSGGVAGGHGLGARLGAL